MEAASTFKALAAPTASITPWVLFSAAPAVVCKSLPAWMLPEVLFSAPSTVSVALRSATMAPPWLLALPALMSRSDCDCLTVEINPLSLFNTPAARLMPPPETNHASLLTTAVVKPKFIRPSLLTVPWLSNRSRTARPRPAPARMLAPALLLTDSALKSSLSLAAMRPPFNT